MLPCIAVLAMIAAGCNSTKYLPDGAYLYKGADVHFTHPQGNDLDTAWMEDELVDLSKMEPNEKLLGVFPLKTWLYVLGDTAIDHYIKYQEVYDTRFLFLFDYDTLLKRIPMLTPESSFRRWLMYNAGEAPQLLDKNQAEETAVRMSNWLYNRGYFYNSAAPAYTYDEKKQSGTVQYTVELGKLYRMRNVKYDIDDPMLISRINNIETPSALVPGKPIDVDLLKGERNRISEHLRNNGYYKFQKEYVYFEVDTASGFDSLDIYVKVSLPARDTVHHPYRIHTITVYPNAAIDYQPGVTPTGALHYVDSTRVVRRSKAEWIQQYAKADTTAAGRAQFEAWRNGKQDDDATLRYYLPKDTSGNQQFRVTASGKIQRIPSYKARSDYFLVNSPANFNPKAIADNLFINPDAYYSDSLIQKTVASFSTLGVFKYVTIQADEISDSSSYVQELNLLLRLDPLPTKTISYELNANTTSDYLLGNAINVSYIHKNLFHRLDQLKISIRGGIETQLAGPLTFINTSEFNAGLGLTLPEFMWPIPIQVPKRYFPKTNLRLNFNYIDQINDFTLFNTSFEYEVSIFETTRNTKAQKQHIFKLPIPTLNIVRVPNISEAFKLELETNPLLKQSFEEVLIMGYGYTFLLNTQPTGKHVVDHYLRASSEINMPFADFMKIDADYRTYVNINPSNRLVFRASNGFAIPFGSPSGELFNTQVIPYVKQFFTGGAYSVRAFTVRKLGPGGFVAFDTTSSVRVDQVADFKLEANLEYRFDIISILEGAVFMDIGNTFTLKEDPFRPYARFKFNDFYRLLAVGPGFGLRLDFSYFVIRIDAAYPLYDPALDGPYRDEVLQDYLLNGFEVPEKQVAINLAIGYPF